MPLTIEELYDQSIKPLTTEDRLKLAKLILNDIPTEPMVDYSDDWSEEDLRDARLHSMKRLDAILGEESHAA